MLNKTRTHLKRAGPCHIKAMANWEYPLGEEIREDQEFSLQVSVGLYVEDLLNLSSLTPRDKAIHLSVCSLLYPQPLGQCLVQDRHLMAAELFRGPREIGLEPQRQEMGWGGQRGVSSGHYLVGLCEP